MTAIYCLVQSITTGSKIKEEIKRYEDEEFQLCMWACYISVLWGNKGTNLFI